MGGALSFACWPTLPVGRRGPSLRSIKGFILLVFSYSCPLCGGTGGGHLWVCWSLKASPRTPFRSATIIYNVLAELPIKRSWLCTSIISWQPLPKAITTLLKILKQFDRRKVFRL